MSFITVATIDGGTTCNDNIEIILWMPTLLSLMVCTKLMLRMQRPSTLAMFTMGTLSVLALELSHVVTPILVGMVSRGMAKSAQKFMPMTW